MTLESYVLAYILQRDVSREYHKALLAVAREFSGFLGRGARLSDLNDDNVNRWLQSLVEANGQSRITLRNKRTMLLILWRAAWMDHKLKLPPGRIRRIAAPKQYVSAWTPAQIEQLLAVASRAEGRFKRHQVQRAAFWRAFILTGYYSALRVGDLLRLTWSEVRGDAIVTVQHKTGDPIVCRLPPDCLAAMQAIHSIDRPRVFGDLLCRKRVLKGFAALVRQAGLSGGTKMLRRTSATAVDGAGRFFAPNT